MLLRSCPVILVPSVRVFVQRAAEIKRLKQQNQDLARARETSARAHGKDMSDHERAVAERKNKQQRDLQVRSTPSNRHKPSRKKMMKPSRDNNEGLHTL